MSRSRSPRSFLATISGLAAVLVALVGIPAPAHAVAPSYVALGSYASGLGTRSYIDDGTSCKRSIYAYPKLVAAQKAYALTFKACSGATVSTVTNTQLSALSTGIEYVTISVGGNDAGFAGHAVCDDVEWINGLSSPVDESYHPNRLGQSSGYQPQVAALLVG